MPVTRKPELLERQKANRQADPFGGFSTLVRGAKMPRVYASPGPIYEPEGSGRDYWRMARAIHAAGFRGGDLVHNSFSYHMTPGAFMMESGAFAVGCTVFPAGVGQTEQQLQAIAELRPAAYLGTPSFLRILVEKAAEYADDNDRLHNFNVAAELQGITREEALGGMMCKHTVSIYDMIAEGANNFSMEKYRFIVVYKTAYYSFYLPVALALAARLKGRQLACLANRDERLAQIRGEKSAWEAELDGWTHEKDPWSVEVSRGSSRAAAGASWPTA